MTRVFTKILLFAYISLLLRPFTPFFMDFMAHTFWYAQHMATVHYENGKFHVHYEYLEAVRKSAPENTDHSLRELVSIGDHLFTRLEYNFNLPPVQPRAYSIYSVYFPLIFPGSDYPPPEA